MFGAGEVCPVCFDEFVEPFVLPCSHKVCKRCIKTLMPPRHMLRLSLEDALAKATSFVDLERFDITCPYRCTLPGSPLLTSSNDFYMRLSTDAFHDPTLTKAIICFLIDGSEKYMEMTIRAINSLMYTTPYVFVGVLVPPGYDTMDLYSRFMDPLRIIFREFSTHFDRWNPTQFKLDITQFAEGFNSIFWLDSDTIVYKDLGDIVADFCYSSAKVAFLKDHVCTNEEFLHNWRIKKNPFIPQACFMGFKTDFIHTFFDIWETIWRRWITPEPFFVYPDPLPNFPGSAFCIEQYALGMAIDEAKLAPKDIFEIRRICIPLSEQVFASNLQKKVLKQLMKKFWNHLHFSSSAGLALLTSFSGITTSSGSAFWVDDIEGHIIHFYSMNYEITYGWWTNYSDEIMMKIEQLWRTNNKQQKQPRQIVLPGIDDLLL